MNKKLLFSLAALAIASSAIAQNVRQMEAIPFSQMNAKQMVVKKAPVVNADELVTPPATATIETDWTMTSGTYTNNTNAYTNTNAIAVAFDGNDVYIQGLSFIMDQAWIKGTIDGTTVTFANGQYLGDYATTDTTYSVYACGTDGNALTDIYFTYDEANKTLTLTNYLLENTSATEMSFFLYAYNVVLTKDLPPVVTPTGLEVNDITATAATALWTGDYQYYNLRYRTTGTNFADDFESGMAGWTTIDADGDGHVWEYANSSFRANSGNGVMVSASYDNNVGALTPDNWLVSPKVNLGGTLTFYATGQDLTYYAEKFGVFVSTGDPTDVTSFTQLGDDQTITSGRNMVQYTFDLSDYAGQKGYVAFRHYGVTDMFWLNLDDVAITLPDGVDAGEWVVVENVNNPYTIDGLIPETNYEVQVQSTEVSMALRGLNDRCSEWTTSVEFTTLPDQAVAIDAVKSDVNATVRYYDISGRYVGTSLDNAPAGLYIGSNGKKVVK